LRRRLLISYVSITALVLVLLEIPLGFAFARAERRRVETTVQHDAFALALRSEELLLVENRTRSRADIQRLAERYHEKHGGRVVFVDSNGDLLADSEPAAGTSVGSRTLSASPEITRALRGHDSTGERYSRARDLDLLYVAVPVATGNQLHGAVRITYPLSVVESQIRDNWYVLAAVGAAVLLVVFGVSIVVARSIASPLAEMEQGAIALGRGDLTTRVAVPDGPHELHTLARSFNSTAARLEQLVDAQQAFVADASHQLRTPLAALRLRLENIEREIAVGRRDDLEGALEEVNRLSVLVDGLLELARAGQQGSSPQPIDTRALVLGRRDAWSALAEERAVHIDVQVDDTLVLATPGRLEQVLDNLLNNALEVAPAGSTIEVSAVATNGDVRLSVADAGPGLSDEQRTRAFDRFWRAGRGTDPDDGDHAETAPGDEGGFGLGLAIVRQLVVADGGEVTLGRSAAGGLEVVVTLPPAPDDRRQRSRAIRRGDPRRRPADGETSR
jgi:signal transduction histidine kinase